MSAEQVLADLTSAYVAEDDRAVARSHPRGWEPGVEMDGEGGTITLSTDTLEPLKSYDDALRFVGVDPEGIEVLEPIQSRAWDANLGDGKVQRMYYHKVSWRRVRAGIGAAALLAEIKAHTVRKRAVAKGTGEPRAFVMEMGDLQLGKVDGDGLLGTTRRALEGIDRAVARLEALRKVHNVTSVYLPWLGDCIEGFNSQGGQLQWRVQATLTDQVLLLQRLMLAQVKAFAPLAERVVVPVVPGNHDEAVRSNGSKGPTTTYTDSWALHAARTLGDTLSENRGYDHVSIRVPARDELTLTLDFEGTLVGMAHGHQFGSNVERWWGAQAHGCQPIGDATLLLGAHKHHLVIQRNGYKTFIQCPALDGGSQWWKHQTGMESPPGIVTLLVGGGGWSDLEVL